MNTPIESMRYILSIAAAMLVVMAPARGLGDTDDNKVPAKEIRSASRQARSAEKQLRKEGYRYADIGSATADLEHFFLKVASGCPRIVGGSGWCLSENLAKLTALANAANEYAVLQGGTVRGRIVSTQSSLSGQQVDDLVASFERYVQKDIQGELIPCATFYRRRGREVSARIYCIVDEDAAARARRHAMELAMQEQSLAQQYGSMASDWIDEALVKEEVRSGL